MSAFFQNLILYANGYLGFMPELTIPRCNIRYVKHTEIEVVENFFYSMNPLVLGINIMMRLSLLFVIPKESADERYEYKSY